MSQGWDRRTFLRGAGLAAGAVVASGLAGCSDDAAPTAASGRSTPTGSTAPLEGAPAPGTASRRAIADLERRLRGRVLVPADAGFADAALPQNGRYREERPQVIAQCADEADVVTCVRWARTHGVAPTVRGGGHSYAGFSIGSGLLIDVGQLRALDVNPRTGRAVMSAATRNEDIYAATKDGRWFLPGGTCPTVGVGGLVLGGGIGYNTHWAGLTADHLVSTRIVTADGEVREVSARREPDLFWALRGAAGGSFGVNTSFTFDLVGVPQRPISFYRYTWRGAENAGAVLQAFDRIQQNAPGALNAVATAKATPVGDGGPREAVDVMSRGQYIGPLAELKDLVRPLLEAAPDAQVTYQEAGFWDIFPNFISDVSTNHSFGDISRFADRTLPTRVFEQYADLLADAPRRTASENPSIWALAAQRLIEPYTPLTSYQNFPNRLLADPLQAYYGRNLRRLSRIKARYDADNLFQNPQSIPPRV